MQPSLVRLFRERAVIGAGFLAAPDIVLTCQHVVRAALGLAEGRPVEPGAGVTLDFPFLKSGPLPARVLQADAEKDIAVLRLEAELPPDARPAPLVTLPEAWGRPFRACGFPQGHPDGVWADGVLRDLTARGWLQIEDPRQTGYFIRPGFSGAPVWDPEAGGVVGMVVTVEGEPGVRVAFCIPTARLVDFWPDLRERAVPPNPYRGLRAFREQDAPFFFGREAFADRLAEEVKRHPFTAVIGPSGSGKSSVVFAGLIPRLRRRAEWAIAAARPGREPFAELASALLPLLEPGMTETDRLRETPKLAGSLKSGEIPLDRLARCILEKGGQEHLLVVVDQWEELYTLSPEDVRRPFVDLWLHPLTSAPLHPSTPLHLLLTLRADFMGQALAYRPLADALDGRTLLLGPMNRGELERAVVRPAENQGVKFEDGLVARILDDVGDEPGNLPLLEFALTQLWERQERGRLTHRAY
ncbi:MAG: trypsin-like peptidase domain-containing protein, partial [Anaerolineae bacterium]